MNAANHRVSFTGDKLLFTLHTMTYFEYFFPQVVTEIRTASEKY